MYNVLLNQEISQATQAFLSQFFAVPEDDMESTRVPTGTVEFIHALLARAEDDWNQEKSEFQCCYREQFRLEDGVCDAITRITAAAELLVKCNYVITYRCDDWTGRRQLNALRKPFVEQACRLVKLVAEMTNALQVKNLVKKVENAIVDPDLRGDAVEHLFVRKVRMSYAEHLANLCVRIHEMYQSALPAELPIMRLRAQIYRNMAALLIEIARADEQHQRDVVGLLKDGRPTPGIVAEINALLGAQSEHESHE